MILGERRIWHKSIGSQQEVGIQVWITQGLGAVVVLFQAIAGDSHSWSPASSSPDASLPDHVQPVRYRSVTLQAHHRASVKSLSTGAQPPRYARWPPLGAGYPTSRHAAAIKPSESAVTCLRVAICPPRALPGHFGLDSAFVGSGRYRPFAAGRDGPLLGNLCRQLPWHLIPSESAPAQGVHSSHVDRTLVY